VASSIGGAIWGTTSTTPVRRTSSGVADALLLGQSMAQPAPTAVPRGGNHTTTTTASTPDASMFATPRRPATSALDDTTAQLAKLKQGLDSYSDLDQRIQALSQGLLDTMRGSQVSWKGIERWGGSSCAEGCWLGMTIQLDLAHPKPLQQQAPLLLPPYCPHHGSMHPLLPVLLHWNTHACSCSQPSLLPLTFPLPLPGCAHDTTTQEGLPAGAAAATQQQAAAAAGPDLDALIAEVKMCSEAALRASGDKALTGTPLVSGDSMTPEQLQAALRQSQQLSTNSTPSSNLNTGVSDSTQEGGVQAQQQGGEAAATPGAGMVVGLLGAESAAAESAEQAAMLQQQLEDVLSANEDLRQQLVAAERAAAEAADEEDVWVEERAALEAQVMELKAAAAAAAEESRQLVAGEVTQLLQDNAALQARLTALSSDSAALEQLRVEHESLQSQVLKLEASLEEYASLQAAHQQLMADHAALQANLVQLQAQLAAALLSQQQQQGMAPSGQEEAWVGAHPPLVSAGDDQEGMAAAAAAAGGGGVPEVLFSRGLPQEAAAAPSTAAEEDEVGVAVGVNKHAPLQQPAWYIRR
jgi:hypothetical protein